MQHPSILILGAGGQVGRALAMRAGRNATALLRAQADLSRPDTLEEALAAHVPSIVINAAAYTMVDKAESERELAFTVNAESPGVIARFCARRGIPLIHYSTDYVFDGSGTKARTEDEPTRPLNTYGLSKRLGEEAVLREGGRPFILRTSWVYDEWGKNFPNTILRLASEREELTIVADQWGAPTYAGHLAHATLALGETVMKGAGEPGIYHLCHQGAATWHEFAESICREARKRGMRLAARRILPIRTEDYPTPAERPRNSLLDCRKIAKNFGLALPAWQDGLKACMANRYGND